MILHGRSSTAARHSTAARSSTAARRTIAARSSTAAPTAATAPRTIAARTSTAGRRSIAARYALIAGAAALVPVVAGCEAGANAPTSQWHPPTGGASATLTVADSTGQIAIRNAFVLGAPTDGALTAGSSAGMFLAIINTGPRDRLVSISAPGTATAVRLPGHGITVRQDQPVLLTGPAPKVILDSLTHGLGGGQIIRMIMNFQNAGSVTLRVPVMPKAAYYASFSPAPTPSATKTPTGSASATPSPSATP